MSFYGVSFLTVYCIGWAFEADCVEGLGWLLGLV